MPPPVRMAVLSTEYIRVPVSAREAGVVVDPTADPVEVAFKETGEPEDIDWHNATWETDGGTRYVRALVGPNGVALAVGKYTIWVKITDFPETPVRSAGKLIIY